MSTKNGVLDINELAWLVQSKYGVNLSKYRDSCIRRRVAHRLSMVGCGSIDEYFDFMNENPGEIGKLMDVITIHVTSFFRDRDVFNALERNVLPAIIKDRVEAKQDAIRIWSAGCATGEETYSLAMLTDRVVRENGSSMAIEVFGTDLSEESCKTARAGVYSEESVKDVPLDFREKYLERDGETYRISEDIRKLARFRPHDLFSAPPYSLLDLIFCRNVLIHFEHDVRDAVNMNFHNALKSRGFLILGKSEALSGPVQDMFELLDPRCKVYRKNPENQYPKED